MSGYLLRRLLAAVPILVGVNVITFALFFLVNPPERMARRMLGEKNVTPAQVQTWLHDRDYDLPLFLNTGERGVGMLTRTIFFKRSVPLFWFQFGESDRNHVAISEEIRRRMGPSLAFTVPTFILELITYLTAAMLIAWVRGTVLDMWALVACVMLMSISSLFYVVGGQWVLAKSLRWVPISGYAPGAAAWKFVILPVLVGLAAGAGGSIRFYRTIFLEELGRDHIRTARAKGLAEEVVLFKHALKNAMLPILTNEVSAILFLFTGSLILENFFGIPGLGNYVINAIDAQDFAVVRAMTYLGSVLFLAGLILTDISYTLVDPRVRLE